MIFHVTEGSRYVDCRVCGKPTDSFDGTRNPGCLLTPDKDHRVHTPVRGVFVYADPLPVCEWYEGCERRPIVGGDLCFEHDQQWRAEVEADRANLAANAMARLRKATGDYAKPD